MNLLISLRSEILKTKRTASVYLTLVAAALGPLMSMLDLIFDGVPAEDKTFIFEKMLTAKFQMTGFVVFPFFLMLICTLLPQIEYKNNTWKQVLTSPQTKAHVFVAKFINIQLLIVIFLVTYQLLMFANAVILHFMEPSLHVLNQPINGYRVLVILVNSYTGLLALCSIQFWLGLRFKNFVVPIAIGIACWFIGTILVIQFKSGFAAYFPYSFHIYGNFPQFNSQLSTVGLTSFVYAVLFLTIGFLDFRRRRMNV
jgi:hypothetical protein